jgi:hypothetical protein
VHIGWAPRVCRLSISGLSKRWRYRSWFHKISRSQN